MYFRSRLGFRLKKLHVYGCVELFFFSYPYYVAISGNMSGTEGERCIKGHRWCLNPYATETH